MKLLINRGENQNKQKQKFKDKTGQYSFQNVSTFPREINSIHYIAINTLMLPIQVRIPGA
jgi:hypothetical protein